MKQLAIDVGGTFTDCLVLDEVGHLERFKAASTPEDPTTGFFDAVGKAAHHHGQGTDEFVGDIERIVHGTTIGINTLLTGRGARVGLLTTQGFRDVVEMRRGIKNLHGSMFDQFIEPYKPLVPRHRRLGVTERTLYTGTVLTPLDEEETRVATRHLVADGCEAIAIGFLHSYANPANELRAKELVAEEAPALHVVASHQILPVWREFERFSSTVVSACIGPAIAGYLERLEDLLAKRGFRGALLMMLANGLVQVVDQCKDRAVYLLGSGPAAAPSAALHVGRSHGREDLLSVDMGGTSFDVCVVKNGEVPTTTDAWVGEERVAVRMVDVSSIGAGGGSIGWIDSLGLLRVGPMSAGADPGPAAYGIGLEPTVTDADIVLGYVSPDYFLGGEMPLDADRARAALARAGEPIGLSVEEAARALFATVTEEMSGKITEVCTKRGYDVRDFALIAGGGAGGVHAAAIAERLSIPMVIVPRVSALMSAFGMFTMDLGQQYARTRFRDLTKAHPADITAVYDEMRAEAVAAFTDIGVRVADLRFRATVDMRYAGQFYEVEIEIPDGPVDEALVDALVRRFHEHYEVLNGYQLPWQPVEFLTFYLKVTSPRPPLELAGAEETRTGPDAAYRGTRRCLFDEGWRDTPVYDAELLLSGHRIAGPAVVDDPTTTVLVPQRFTLKVDPFRNLVLSAAGTDDDVVANASAAVGR